jgi:hypothetical protein
MADGPVLQSLSLPTIIDLGVDPHLHFSATATDASSSITSIQFTLDHGYVLSAPYMGPRTGSPTPEFSNSLYAYSSGSWVSTGLDPFSVMGNQYSAGFTFNIATPPGIYHVTGAYLADAAGNTAHYSPEELSAIGAPTAFLVKPDTIAPTLSGLQVQSPEGGYGTGSIRWQAADTGVGVERVVFHFDHALQSGNTYLAFERYDLSFSYGWSLTRDPGMPAVAYNLLDIQITDFAHNSVSYSGDQLRAMGFSTRLNFGVTSDSDFNGDGRADVFWHNVNGAVSVWQGGNGGQATTLVQDTYDSAVSPGWNVAGTFDFDGDGKADLLWRHENGATSIWKGTASGFQQAAYNDMSVSTAWRIGGAGDVNGDGRGDIVWQKNDGSISAWYSDGFGFIKEGYVHGPVGSGWQIAGLGDFNGDGKGDLLWRHSNGYVSTWNSTGTGFQENSFTDQVLQSWHIVGVGDYNGDGRDDLFWLNDNGAVSVWQGTAGGFAEAAYNSSVATVWNVAQTGDFNGDGVSDVLWRSTSADTAIWTGSAGGFNEAAYVDGSVPLTWAVDGHDFPV